VSHQYQGVLDALTRVRGVQGAMFVAREDGLAIADALMEGVRGKALGALAASAFSRYAAVSRAIEAGAPRFFQLQCKKGVVLVVAAGGEVLVVVVADAAANIGLIRLEMLRAAEVFA